MPGTNSPEITSNLAASITKKASTQTYFTIRLLVDREKVQDAYRAYAYFRWVDDELDAEGGGNSGSKSFVERQRSLLEACYRREPAHASDPHEQLLIELVQSSGAANDGLQVYLRNMMNVMAFDAERRGRLISQLELNAYTRSLATAVTEAMHYFIGHDCPAPQDDTRYHAVTAAHITHMLRDTFDDIRAGYYNIPREVLEADRIGAAEISSKPYREWVKSRVELARKYFKAGRAYLLQVESARCRIAGFAYASRFEGVLKAIEKDGYLLRDSYTERQGLAVMARAAGSIFHMAMDRHHKHLAPLHEKSLRGL